MKQEQRKTYYTPELKKIGTVKELTQVEQDPIRYMSAEIATIT